MADNSSLHILVIDDDADTRHNLSDILELDDHRADTAATIAEALRRNNWADYAAILLDRKLPDGTAEEVLPKLRQLAPHAAILIITGYSDLQGAISALRQGAADYIVKPINPEALRASLHRIAEHRRLHRDKERSEAAFRTLVEAAPSMILILRPDRSITYFSQFARELTGYSGRDALGKDFTRNFLPEGYRHACEEELGRVFHGVPCRGYQAPLVCKDGTHRWMVWNAQRLDDYEGASAVLAVGQDITRLKEAQEKALQSERLAAIGQMMAGLAHESGNALARSQACLEMLTWEVQDKPDALDLITRIQKAQDHLQQLYEEVRGYAAPLKLEREEGDIRPVWRQAWTNLALRRESRDATLTETCDGAVTTCSFDGFRIEQVFRNMMENSLAACADPVRIHVTATNVTLEDRPAVRISVRDNGPGLTLEQRQRIFEPFFTTKTKGTGLGMAIAKRIAEAHGGQIAVAPSEPGQGAEIILTLPRDIP
jgi:PAS domain S-box-containing protein